MGVPSTIRSSSSSDGTVPPRGFDRIKRVHTDAPALPKMSLQLRHVDHGYASTSHAAQGATADRVIVNVDSMPSSSTAGSFMCRYPAPGTTPGSTPDDAEALRRAVSKEPRKDIALEAVEQRSTQELRRETRASAAAATAARHSHARALEDIAQKERPMIAKGMLPSFTQTCKPPHTFLRR